MLEASDRLADGALVVDVAGLDRQRVEGPRRGPTLEPENLDVVYPAFVDGERQAPRVEGALDTRFRVSVAIVEGLELGRDRGGRAVEGRPWPQLQQPQDVVVREDGCAVEVQLGEHRSGLRILGGRSCRQRQQEQAQDEAHHGIGTNSSWLKFPSPKRNARTVRVPCASETITCTWVGSFSLARSVSDGPEGPLGWE